MSRNIERPDPQTSPSNRRGFCLRIRPILSYFAIIIFSIASMNFLHYLYAKGETVFYPRLGGRALLIAPIWFLSIISTTPFMPLGIEQFSFILLSLCWLGILIGVSYILLPKKEAETKLKSWVRKYKKTTTLYACLYLLSPILFLLFYLFIS